ncbi:Zn-finger nucleic acid-binding protein [Bradyrhizobium sp. USDA 4369]|jgi:hypothetical protein|uniref:zf-TFIIB domain-containing protein n=1 Tax=Caulobacter sp. SSI4214 TaxID=2575739 RepID=UPI00143A46EF
MERTEGNGMLCPVCRVDLVISERQNIEIDYCPKCRGVWLDRGELDKIIERSTAETSQVSQQRSSAPPSSSEAPSAPGPWGGYDQHGGHGGHGSRDGHGSRGGHGRGFLGRLFD